MHNNRFNWSSISTNILLGLLLLGAILDIATIVVVVFWICSSERKPVPREEKETALYTGALRMERTEEVTTWHRN